MSGNSTLYYTIQVVYLSQVFITAVERLLEVIKLVAVATQ
jgi:hypothetical protein